MCFRSKSNPYGFDFAAQVKKDPALMQTPLIVYSGSRAPQDIHRAYSLGVNVYLAKPMTIDTMVQQVECSLSFGWTPPYL
jgi:CheY-like chemotaxis protein